MKLPRYTIPVTGLVALLLFVVAVAYGRGKPVKVTGQIKPEQANAIERAYRQLQRDSIHKAVASTDVPSLFGSLKDLAFGRVREVGSWPDGRVVVSCGYVWNSGVNWAEAFEQTTPGTDDETRGF